MSAAIKVENLSKKYTIGHLQGDRYVTLRDKVGQIFKTSGKRLLHPFLTSSTQFFARLPTSEEIWALRDVSFEVNQGERVGIIGRNGAGKSTLLKVLSRITEPTIGRVRIRGRVASLLEVGTGFHPELTGRENIFLNGAVLGMTKAEIRKKFDEIVAFAEIEKFLDTPVKRYSSGMYVRLAFAVAAHLEPEILLVDEVLAVGDVHFQKKCLNKMENVASDGKTILYVSHNMASIMSLSTKCILISEGQITEQGLPQKVISIYQNNVYDETFGQSDLSKADRYGNGHARFLSIFMQAFDQHCNKLSYPITGCDLELEVTIEAYRQVKFTTVAVTVYDELGSRLIDVNTLIKGDSLSLAEKQKAVVKFFLKNVCLKPGAYTAGLWLGIPNVADIDGVRYATSFRMEARREDILYTTPYPGVYACEFHHKIIIK